MLNRRVTNEVKSLFSGSQHPRDEVFTHDQLSGLPAPVQRYFRYCLNEGQRYIACARLRHGGAFRTGEGRKWMPIAGEEYFAAQEPGFLWRGKVKPLPFYWITARDRYYQGKGNMLIKLFSILTIADSKGEEMDQSSLLRFFAEAPLFPTALLPGRYLAWEPLDEDSAKAVVSHRGIDCSLVLHFNEEGQATHVTTEDRFRDVKGKFARAAWTGQFGDYQDIGGMRIPTVIEAVWNLPGGDFSYGRFTVTEIEYDNPSRY